MTFDPISYSLTKRSIEMLNKKLDDILSTFNNKVNDLYNKLDELNNKLEELANAIEGGGGGQEGGGGGASPFDEPGGGTWKYYINIPLINTPNEQCVYEIVIDGVFLKIYSADGKEKLNHNITGLFWDWVKGINDIRVFDQAGSQLYFWVENLDVTRQKARIWVSIPAGTSALNIAFGNESAGKSEYNDPSKVFLFFDDFVGEVGSMPEEYNQTGGWIYAKDGDRSIIKYKSGSSVDLARIIFNYELPDKFVVEVVGKSGVGSDLVILLLENNDTSSAWGTGYAVGWGLALYGTYMSISILFNSNYDIRKGTSIPAPDNYEVIKLIYDHNSTDTMLFKYKNHILSAQWHELYFYGKRYKPKYLGIGTYAWVCIVPVCIDSVKVIEYKDLASFGTPSIVEF